MDATPWNIIISIAVIVGIYNSGYLLFKKNINKKATCYLSLFLFSISMILGSNLIVLSKFYQIYPFLIGLSFPFWFIISQFFYFYVIHSTEINRKIKWYDFLHFVPFFYNLYTLISFYSIESSTKLKWFQSILEQSKEFTIISMLIVFMGVFYLILSFLRYRQFENKYKNEIANTNIELFKGVKRLIIVYMFYLILDFIAYLSSRLTEQNSLDILQFMSIAISIFIFTIAYTIVKDSQIFFISNLTSNEKYKTSRLKDRDVIHYANVLTSIMDKNKPYLNSNIKLEELAKQIGINRHELSQIINQHFGVNFYDFVNNYRINIVKKRLVDPKFKQYTILAVALETGFNSKSAFNKIFKEYSGQSPSEYVKSTLA